ncbi:GntR family transcriptional regulator [Epibacterium ulvae]|uniref:GntR family transcriptional regulator n=1 Tax=Epibacterium ulvae TaxID=1156985 RepID=UPI001BFC25CF|nr:GntR family transcriptional regulator [Epibacterium ulvae]MBT8153528.1 GntR family transcriptional regulator [Epibacterium ulvae]
MSQTIYERRSTTSALPIYVQISEVLIREIASGRLIDGTCLPPERELAKQHFTTVRTLRKALEIVEEKGLIERVHGSGNYVRSSTAVESIYSMFRLELTTGGGLPTAHVLSVDALEKPSTLPEFGTSNRGTRIRRLRYLNRIPIAVEEIWLDESVGRIDPNTLSDSLYRYYKMQLGFWISRAEDSVGVDGVPEWAPDDFPPPAHTPVGYIERFSHSDQVGTVEYSKTWFDHTSTRYVQRLK